MKKLIPIFVLLGFWSCSQEQEESAYLRWIGDIPHNETTDQGFTLCHNEGDVMQYFHTVNDNDQQYEGEKPALEKSIRAQYKPVETDQSGWIRIRFIVNCKGETGRFRIISSDFNYEEMTFDAAITDQLLAIAKSLDGWIPQPKENPRDFYKYLTFTIEQGNLTQILP